jgi:transposase
MARSYQQDLRDRVIDAVEQGGMSCRGAAERFGVSESSAIRWVRQYRQSGRRTPIGTGGHRPSTLVPHRAFLMAELAGKSDITLAALCRRLAESCGVRSDTGTMSRFLRREGITAKKRRSSPRSRTAPT